MEGGGWRLFSGSRFWGIGTGICWFNKGKRRRAESFSIDVIKSKNKNWITSFNFIFNSQQVIFQVKCHIPIDFCMASHSEPQRRS